MSSKYCLLAVLVMFLAAAPASAYIINVTQNTPLWYDGYELQSGASTSHTGYMDAATAALPQDANILYGDSYYYNYGGWGNTPSNRIFQVTDHAGAGNSPYESFVDPGAYTGDNYFRSYRLTSDEYPVIANILSEIQNTPGDHIHWEQMVYITNEANGAFLAWFRDFTESKILLNFGAQAGGAVTDAQENVISGLTYTTGIWQKWEMDYVMGESTFALTIDGTTVSGLAVDDSTCNINAASFTMFASNFNTGPFYLDEPFAVPEPSTFALLAASLIGLLAYAWKKRK